MFAGVISDQGSKVLISSSWLMAFNFPKLPKRKGEKIPQCVVKLVVTWENFSVYYELTQLKTSEDAVATNTCSLSLSLSLFFSLLHSRHGLAGEGGAAEGPGHRGWLPSPRRRYPCSSGYVLLLLSQERRTASAICRLDGSGKQLTCTVTGVCTPR